MKPQKIKIITGLRPEQVEQDANDFLKTIAIDKGEVLEVTASLSGVPMGGGGGGNALFAVSVLIRYIV